MKPWASATASEPAKNTRFQAGFFSGFTLARNSKATPRRMSPDSMTATGR